MISVICNPRFIAMKTHQGMFATAFVLFGLCSIPMSQSQDKYVIPKMTPSDCVVDDSAEFNQFYDTSQLRCTDCKQNSSVQTVSEDGLRCTCRGEYKIATSLGNPNSLLCVECPDGEVASRDGWNCVTCSVTSSRPTAELCPECTEPITLTADRNLTGHWLSDDQGDNTVTCVRCQNGTSPDYMKDRCIRCNQELSVQPKVGCVCPADRQAGGICFASTADLLDDVQLDYSVTYDVTTVVHSAYLSTYLRSAQAYCTNFTKLNPSRLDYSNLSSCQRLANMCVMTLYSSTHWPPQGRDDPCSLHQRLIQSYPDSTFPPHDEGPRATGNRILSWRANMPWLYYLSELDDSTNDILTDASIDQVYSRQAYLQLTVQAYNLQGEYLGLKALADLPITLCPMSTNDVTSAFTYGTKFDKKCSISVDSLFTSEELPLNFYDLYLSFVSGSKKETLLHAVPLLITNYISPDNELVNQGDDMTKWQLLRRYFLVDRVTGIEIGEQTPNVIRYLRDVTIHIRQQSTSEPGLIYPPYVEMTYDFVTAEQRNKGQFVQVSFAMRYHVDLTRTGRDLSIAVGIMSAAALTWAIIQTVNWNRRQGKLSVDCSTILRFITYSFGSLANAFFITVLGYSLWQFIVYKAQTDVFIVPDDAGDFYVKAFIGSAFVLKFIDVVQLVIAQSTVGVFFVDWERDPDGDNVMPRETATASARDATRDRVSIWRRIMVANEWSELQVERQVKPFWQLMFMLVILHVAGIENLARVQTRTTLNYSDSETPPPYNMVFRIALSASVYIGLAIIQWIYHKFWSSCVQDRIMNFVDLCSLANISVFILPYHLYGYYIHGRSAHGRADVSLQEMHYNLLTEERDLCGHRGLMPGSDVQTFEVFLPRTLRTSYDKLFYFTPRQMAKASGTSSSVVLDSDTERRIAMFPELNKFLQKYIDHNLPGVDYVISEKTFFQRIMDHDPVEGFDLGYFFIDGAHRFDNVLFYGQEMLLVVYEVLTFSIVDMIAADFILAAIVTYVMSQVIIAIRQAAAKKNLSIKSAIDSRFLI